MEGGPLVRGSATAQRTAAATFDPAALEAKWQARWAGEGVPEAHAPDRADWPKYYALSMFPYPSGNLHMGHVRVYTISDAIARLQRMRGHNVLHPIGWDAFGLPAENAALERGISPADWTVSNIARMRAQLQRLGMTFNWDREVTTCAPEYYKWTQWLFLQMMDAGYAYRREAEVNWDPVDRTVLANEQVDADGRSWRSGAPIERRTLSQWFLRITDLASDLDAGIAELGGWPESVRAMQRNWIGASEGVALDFALDLPAGADAGTAHSLRQALAQRNAAVEVPPSSAQAPAGAEGAPPSIRVFTTRVDTVHGATFVAVSPDHPLVDAVLGGYVPCEGGEEALADVRAYVADARGKQQQQRRGDGEAAQPTGVRLGVRALHPITGEGVSVVVGDYVLGEYGTGAVMGVPAHDGRDWAVSALLNLPRRRVIVPARDGEEEEGEEGPCLADGVLCDSGDHTGLTSAEARARIAATAQERGVGGPTTQYRLRDWLVSRQRYWGCPIPVVHCGECGAVPVPESDLPVELPPLGTGDLAATLHGGQGREGGDEGDAVSPLARMAEWVSTPCPHCGGPAHRETDTLDTFVDSSWYFLRYPDAANGDALADRGATDRWMPVDTYVGGVEHAVLHLLYARFVSRFMHKQGLLDTPEPFKALLTQGMVLGETHKHPETGRYFHPHEVSAREDGTVVETATGLPVATVHEKMSKSKHNGVDPTEVIDRYGADVTRLATLFIAPPEQSLEWSENALAGQRRWLERVWRLVHDVHGAWDPLDCAAAGAGAEEVGSDGPAPFAAVPEGDEAAEALRRATHVAINRVTTAMHEHRAFNVAIAELMKLSNSIGEAPRETAAQRTAAAAGTRALTLMLAPLAPHTAAELWQRISDPAAVVSPLAHTRDGGDLCQPDVHLQRWPEAAAEAMQAATVPLVIQVMGKRRGEVTVPADVDAADADALHAYVASSEVHAKWLAGRKVTRMIPVKRRGAVMLNYVLDKQAK